MRNKLIICLSVFATILSITSVCFVLFRCEPFNAEWMSILVGILSLLTTSLIGWQIIRTIELERTIRHFDRIVNDRALVVAQDINHIITAFEHRLSSRRPIIQPESQEKSIMYLIMALEEVLNVETPGANRESIDNIMRDFMELVDLYKEDHVLQLNKEEQERYLSILRRVEHEDAIFLIKYISRAQL